MKRFIAIILLCCFALSLCGCSDWDTTKEYRSAKAVYNAFVDGKEYTKQTLNEELGLPQYPKLDYYSEAMGLDQETMLFSPTTTEWVYFVYQLSDPANPYDLVINFDNDGKATNMAFGVVPGG